MACESEQVEVMGGGASRSWSRARSGTRAAGQKAFHNASGGQQHEPALGCRDFLVSSRMPAAWRPLPRTGPGGAPGRPRPARPCRSSPAAPARPASRQGRSPSSSARVLRASRCPGYRARSELSIPRRFAPFYPGMPSNRSSFSRGGHPIWTTLSMPSSRPSLPALTEMPALTAKSHA